MARTNPWHPWLPWRPCNDSWMVHPILLVFFIFFGIFERYFWTKIFVRFKLYGPWDTHGVKIWVRQDLWQVSGPFSTSRILKSRIWIIKKYHPRITSQNNVPWRRWKGLLRNTLALICCVENEDPNPSGIMTSTWDPSSPLSCFPILTFEIDYPP